VGNPDLRPEKRRGLVIFPADAEVHPRHGGEWWLIPAALLIAAAMIAIAFAIR
jgi:hypothetical protein